MNYLYEILLLIVFFFYLIRNFSLQRFGLFLPKAKPDIWIHCASMGEVAGIKPFIDEIRKKKNPSMVISVMTKTGYEVARGFGENAFYLPLDLSFIIRGVLKRLSPKMLIIQETELWPNLIREAKKQGIKIVLINGRLSEKSKKRYLMVSSLMKSVVSCFDLLLMQSEDDKDRIKRLGANEDKLLVAGNTKFDWLFKDIPEVDLTFEDKDIVVFGSIRKKEEEIILNVAKGLRGKKITTIIAPRHLERLPVILKKARAIGLPLVRRTEVRRKEQGVRSQECILLDTIGELRSFYKASILAFVGGSLFPYGGHNLIEPAILSKPVLFGRYTDNFKNCAIKLKKNQGGFEVLNENELINKILYLLENPDQLEKMGRNAKDVALSLIGASKRCAELILGLL